jgi:DNA processing protein
MYDEKLYQVALSLIPGIGDVLIKQLISYCGTAEAVFSKNRGKLYRIPRIGKVLSENISLNKLFHEAEKEINYAEKNGIQVLFFTDKNYPVRLKQIHNSPSILYFKGNSSINHQKIVSIVGTRNATNYGKEAVEEIIKGLTKHQALIVSGLAYGIDIHAHRSALNNGLPTIGIIAGGINKIYPNLHRETAYKMIEHGGIMSEQRWDTIPEAHHFPKRNRIIAGFSDVTIIVEAAPKGGALITAEYAHSYNRDIFAIPGNLNRKYSEGCNHLIESLKANIYTGIESLEKIMNWDLKPEKPVFINKYEQLNKDELLILETLENNVKPMPIDDICWKSQMNINQLASGLLNLEFKGIVRSLPGKMYKIS